MTRQTDRQTGNEREADGRGSIYKANWTDRQTGRQRDRRHSLVEQTTSQPACYLPIAPLPHRSIKIYLPISKSISIHLYVRVCALHPSGAVCGHPSIPSVREKNSQPSQAQHTARQRDVCHACVTQ
mmetsp:Transcript_9158/g.26410  ORF Transcript_9158/g.26410 Transcript_9158/m.26410 type:complete len:126 (-) Transcript_9158:89-466(-)